MKEPLLQIQFHTWHETTFDASSHSLLRSAREQPIDVIEIGKITLYLTPANTLTLRDVLNRQIASRAAEAATQATQTPAETDAFIQRGIETGEHE
jgi:hypothetical protein